jgi:hypothetical protein
MAKGIKLQVRDRIDGEERTLVRYLNPDYLVTWGPLHTGKGSWVVVHGWDACWRVLEDPVIIDALFQECVP